jgi:hypothetical protein
MNIPKLTAVELYTAEANQIHALCDRAAVPRIVEGTTMSISQRVAILEGVCRGLVERLGQDPVHTIQ